MIDNKSILHCQSLMLVRVEYLFLVQNLYACLSSLPSIVKYMCFKRAYMFDSMLSYLIPSRLVSSQCRLSCCSFISLPVTSHNEKHLYQSSALSSFSCSSSCRDHMQHINAVIVSCLGLTTVGHDGHDMVLAARYVAAILGTRDGLV